MRVLRRVVASAVFMALAAVPLLSGISGCATHNYDSTAAMPAGPLPALGDVGLKQIWQRQINLDNGERFTHAWHVGNSVYLSTTFARIMRIDAKSGVLMWSYGLGAENFQIYKPIELHRDDSPAGGAPREVLVVSRGEAFVFRMETGDLARTGHLGVSVSANPLVIGNTLCVGGANTFYGLYLDRLGGKRWVLQAPGDLFDSAPVAVDNNVIVASKRGLLWRLNGDNGDWDWKDRKTNGDVVAGLAADGRAVYVPAMDQRVYAFAVDTGSELWNRQLAGALDVTPALGGPCVMVVAHGLGGVGSSLYGLARQDGAIKWKADDVSQVATVGENSAWVGDNAGNLKSLSLETGEILSSTPIPGAQFFVRNPDDDNLILVTRSGMVALYQPK